MINREKWKWHLGFSLAIVLINDRIRTVFVCKLSKIGAVNKNDRSQAGLGSETDWPNLSSSIQMVAFCEFSFHVNGRDFVSVSRRERYTRWFHVNRRREGNEFKRDNRIYFISTFIARNRALYSAGIGQSSTTLYPHRGYYSRAGRVTITIPQPSVKSWNSIGPCHAARLSLGKVTIRGLT